MRIYGILLKVKRPSFNPWKILDLAFCRSTGWSTATEDGRPIRSTDVHRRGRPVWLEGRSTDPVDCQRALLSGSGPGRPGGRPTESFFSLYPGLGRPGSRPMAQWSEIWPLAGRPGGRPTANAVLDPNDYIFEAINWGCFGLLSTRFLESFQASFSYIF